MKSRGRLVYCNSGECLYILCPWPRALQLLALHSWHRSIGHPGLCSSPGVRQVNVEVPAARVGAIIGANENILTPPTESHK